MPKLNVIRNRSRQLSKDDDIVVNLKQPQLLVKFFLKSQYNMRMATEIFLLVYKFQITKHAMPAHQLQRAFSDLANHVRILRITSRALFIIVINLSTIPSSL